jgi:hypothetical protein
MFVAAAILAIIGIWLGEPLQRATDPANGRSIQTLILFAFTLGSAAAAYLVAAFYLRIPEIHQIVDQIRKRLLRGR